METPGKSQAYVVAAFFFLTIVSAAQAKYSGGTGEPNDPYQIATAADLITLGETPEDYDKHFIMTADIDLDPNLPGGRVFEKALIMPDTNYRTSWSGDTFRGVFDGNGHTISNLTIIGGVYLGLFGSVGGEVRNLGVVDVNISGFDDIGGLVGLLKKDGIVTKCYSTGTVRGSGHVGGVVSENDGGIVTQCYSVAEVSGASVVGGLIGRNDGRIVSCYSAGTVWGTSVEGYHSIGGLVGGGNGSISSSYSAARIRSNSNHGGLVGGGGPTSVTYSVWDIGTSGCLGSFGGVGLTTAEMMDPYMLGLNGFANDPNWILDPGHDYPRLAWEGVTGSTIPKPDIDWMEGQGTEDVAYRIDTADQVILLSRASILWDRHFILCADIDLDPNLPNGKVFVQAVIPAFRGVLDGNSHTISHLTIKGLEYVGLLGILVSTATVIDLGLVDVNVTGSCFIGGLVGYNGGSIAMSYSAGSISGDWDVGGLVGENAQAGFVSNCYSTGVVSGIDYVGGLVGRKNGGHMIHCYSSSEVIGSTDVGGLVGWQWMGSVTDCYNTGSVSGNSNVGGLVGQNNGTCNNCYSVGMVTGSENVGGLVGRTGTGAWMRDFIGHATKCFWDTQTSGTLDGVGNVDPDPNEVTGKTTAEMQRAQTFLDAGWDFVGATKNGTQDIWWILEGKDYPRLWWESEDEASP